MKTKFAVLLTMLFAISSMAQVDDMNVTWGEKIQARKKLVTDILYTGNSSEFYAINSSVKMFGGEKYLEKYEGLSKSNEKELENEYRRGIYSLINILELNDNLYALNSVKTKEKKSLSVQGIDQNSLQFSGSKDMIYNFKLTKGRNYSNGEYVSSISQKEEKIVYAIEHPGNRESKAIMTVKVFDDNFELQWKSKFTLPYDRGLSNIESVNVSDDGKVYLLTQVWKEKKERERKERNYDYYINVVTEDGLESKHKLELKDNYIRELKLNIASNGDLICGGFYSKEGFRSDGVFFMQLDASDFTIEQESLKEFGLDFLTDGMSDRKAAKTKKRANKGKGVGLANVDFRDFIVKEDGGAVLVGEYVRIYTTTSTDANGNTTTTTHYNYDDIYVININPEGGIEWAEKIQKYQHTANDGGFYSSFFMSINDDNLNFMFNVREGREMILHAVSMDGNGKQNSRDLISINKKERIRIRPKSCEQISDFEFILFAIGKKYNQFARVTVD
ncbi:MAG: hypothetical protein COA58_05190 [Bacteroidetes bacterium]|nr:MAG: hypothetical protein COA58_05190 [Bacteroidota bacterium]